MCSKASRRALINKGYHYLLGGHVPIETPVIGTLIDLFQGKIIDRYCPFWQIIIIVMCLHRPHGESNPFYNVRVGTFYGWFVW